jgi:hypothetical protein
MSGAVIPTIFPCVLNEIDPLFSPSFRFWPFVIVKWHRVDGNSSVFISLPLVGTITN